MTKFTDENKWRLLRYMEEFPQKLSDFDEIMGYVSSCLARLEAAEAALAAGHYCHIEWSNTCEGCMALKNWRSVSGKK